MLYFAGYFQLSRRRCDKLAGKKYPQAKRARLQQSLFHPYVVSIPLICPLAITQALDEINHFFPLILEGISVSR